MNSSPQISMWLYIYVDRDHGTQNFSNLNIANTMPFKRCPPEPNGATSSDVRHRQPEQHRLCELLCVEDSLHGSRDNFAWTNETGSEMSLGFNVEVEVSWPNRPGQLILVVIC